MERLGLLESKEYVFPENYVSRKPNSCVKEIRYVINNNGCWICTSHAGSDNRGGYPVVTRHGRFYRMSRYIFEITQGELASDMYVLHACDNPKCINPAHLSAGTPKENTEDMVRKGRKPIGENVSCAKLTEADVRKILKDGRSRAIIARDYGVSKKAIQNVKRRKTWKHVKEDAK